MTTGRMFVCACLGVGTFMWLSRTLDSVTAANSSNYYVGETSTPASTSAEKNTTTTTRQSSFDICILPQFDPWDPQIIPYVSLDYNPLQKCNRNYKPMTTLKNGIVSVNEKDASCEGRCLTRLGERKNRHGKWINVDDADFRCDIVETSCSKEKGKESYRMVHAQIVEVNNTKTEKIDVNGALHSVYVILLDSTAHTQGIRNLPQTMHFFENSMQAVTFPHINKVGLNSRPNGVALWFGKRLEAVNRKLFGLPDIPPDWTYEHYCKTFLDNETFLFKEYSDRGYKTLLAEDWMQGTLNWPNCWGFNKQPTDHYMRPFQIALEKDITENLRKTYNKANCIEQHKDILIWLQDFINAYGDTPKFGWIWLSLLGHDHESGTIHADPDFFRFLLHNKKKLDDSFVIILGDHGLRGGKVTKTDLGSLEVNNPMFSISIPKKLRETTDILEVLRENTVRLQTTFDIRATLLDILKYQPAVNYTDRNYMAIKGEYGSSLMRKQPAEERTCKTLYVPLSYCTCQYPLEEVKRTKQVATDAGVYLVKHINDFLREKNMSTKCDKLVYRHTISISAYVPEEATKTYQISVKVMPPCDGEFKAVVRQTNGNFEMATGSVDRIDRYGDKGDCVESSKHLCHCKVEEQKKTTYKTTYKAIYKPTKKS